MTVGRVLVDEDRHFIHECAVCGIEASFGYGVNLRGDELGSWFCGKHRPDGAVEPLKVWSFDPRCELWAAANLRYDSDGIITSEVARTWS